MLSNIISQIIAHKAAIMLGTAAAGVIGTAVMATKDRDKYVDNVFEEVETVEDEVLESGDYTRVHNAEILDVDLVSDLYKKYISRKRRAIIFLKSYWRTGLLMFLTLALMLLSHISMAKELAATAAALGIMSSKYEELKSVLKEKYPDTYEKVQEIISERNIRGKLADPKVVEHTYDGRNKYYDPWSCQIFFATEAEYREAECAINERMANYYQATLHDFLATFPSSSGVKLEPWMKQFGWYDDENTTYAYAAKNLGKYIKPTPIKKTIIFQGEKEEVIEIDWEHCPDIEPDASEREVDKIDRIMARKAKEMKKKPKTKEKIA